VRDATPSRCALENNGTDRRAVMLSSLHRVTPYTDSRSFSCETLPIAIIENAAHPQRQQCGISLLPPRGAAARPAALAVKNAESCEHCFMARGCTDAGHYSPLSWGHAASLDPTAVEQP